MASLRHDALVARDRPHLEIFDSAEKRWSGFRVVEALGETIDLPAIQATLSLRDISYRVFAG